MSEISKHDNGSFSWAELATSDSGAAKRFYTGLFGWSFADSEAGPGMTYTRLQKGGQDVGALFEMGPDQKGMPPNWGVYFTVASADESTRRANGLGAKTVMGPFDVMEHGRMTVLQDPQGAYFSLWEPRKHPGFQRMNEAAAPCWTELQTKDPAAEKTFYTGLFPWTAKTDAGGYTEWHVNGRPVGGMMEIPPEWGPVPTHWLVYFQVDDPDATVAKAKQLGATPMVPPTTIPNVGRFAVITDPQGANFAVVKLEQTHGN